ncbi:MAG TPA: M1 family metallopeptidase [Bryobacteraceae bacterium]|nr:M1 family metallopeptidase [Bryobacteraceae bacterium]
MRTAVLGALRPAICMLLGWCTVPLRADTYPRQQGIDAIHYVFRLTLSDDTDEIVGDATLDLRFIRDGVSEVALDLATATSGKGMTVSEVSVGGAPVQFGHQADRLRITLASPPHAGEHRLIGVRYHGIPADGLRIGKNKYGERTFFSQNWPNQARQWLPMIDHPYDKATSEFLITAPAKYQVVANGLLQEETDLGDGRRLTHWKQSVPIASWLNAVGGAQFASRHFGMVKGISLQTWVYHQDRDNGIITFEGPARQAMEFYTDHIGLFAYEKLANVEAAGLRGGTEHASAIFYGEASVTNRAATNLVAHEIAHQWFGDSVTEKDWDDVWLSEGFATYFTLLCIEHYEGRDAFVAGLKRSRDTVFATEKRIPEAAVRHNNLADMKKVLNQLVYQKGGWTLHMLRAQMGTDKFWAGIREYYRRYRDSSASTDDFQKVMEENCDADLGWFFAQWLNRPGSPVVDGGWTYDPAAKKIRIELSQTQPGGAYRLPLEVGVQEPGAAQTRIEKIEMTRSTQAFEIAADKEPSAVALDPNTWVLMDARFAKK